MKTDKRMVIIFGLLGLMTIIGVGTMLRAPFILWWQTRAVEQLRVKDDRFSCHINFKNSSEIVGVWKATIKLIESLSEATPDERHILEIASISYSTVILFLPTKNKDAWINESIYYLIYYNIDEGGVIEFQGELYTCSSETRDKFIRNILKPFISDLVDEFNDRDEEYETRVNAALTLAWINPNTEGILKIIIEVINDQRFYWKAAMALSALGPLAEPAVPRIVKNLEKNPALISTLGKIGSASAPAVPVLIQLLDNNEIGEYHYQIVTTLGMIGQAAKNAIPCLEALINNFEVDDRIRSAAKDSLKKIRKNTN